MIKEIINLWEENKLKLAEYFRTTEQLNYGDYEDIVRKIFEICINTPDNEYYKFNISKLHIIDDGDYQGTLLFLIPKDTYQPSIKDYIITSVGYGSCPYCDILQEISENNDKLPSELQVKKYMTLSLHLVQRMKWLK